MAAGFLTPIHYLTPFLLLIPLIFILLPKPGSFPELPGIRPITIRRVTPRRSTISTSLLLLALLSFGDIIILVADLLTARTRHGQDIPPHLKGGQLGGEVIYTLGGLIVWGLTLAAAWWRDRWSGRSLVILGILALGMEIPNLVGLVMREIRTDGYDKIFTILSLVPSSSRLLILPIFLFAASSPRVSFEPADEQTGLLSENTDGRIDPNSASEYGTFDTDSQDQDQDQDQNKSTAAPTNAPSTPTPAQGTTNNATATTETATAAAQPKKIKITKKLGGKREEKKELSFKEAWPKFKLLIPRLWPSTSIKLQFFVGMTGVMIFIDRVLTPLAPISMGFLVRALTERNSVDIWKWLGVYLILRLLNAYGILSAIQQAFWIPVVQYTDREMQMLCFHHLLDLSLAYHTKRNTGEVIRIIERGSAINELFRTVLFSVIPTFADIIIGFSVFIWLFGPLMTGSVLLIMIPYMVFTFFSTQFRKALRRQYVERDLEQRGIVSDVLNNWESVKYFTAEGREFDRFKEAVASVQEVDYKWTMGYQAIYAVQSLLLTLGFAVGSIIIAWNIMRGKGDAALFVIFIQYYGSFTSPLNQLSGLYRSISTDITDSEKMLNLLAEKTEIKDDPDAEELEVTDGVIEFDNVCFSYDGKVEALKNVSFKVGKGESMALVGETGSGKSTILRLIYRFYDVTSGKILIDGQDISKVTQISLRNAIGIVPQDSVLWNDTIGANIAYGKPDSTDEEIIQAAQAGKMHDKIMNFDEGYDTVVGERGVRLSGGEKQRVSLARMFLKSPAILVLDEATSALDTETEREIQKSLSALAKGRSSLSIAHRLSTIINSDRIVVMKNGEILESGGYKELVDKNGAFARMWKRQIYTEAELLEDDDVEKIANTLPTADDFRQRAHSHADGKKSDTKNDQDGPNDGDTEKPISAESSASTASPPDNHKSPDFIDLNDKQEEISTGFTLDAPPPPPPIVEDPKATSFADAVKSAPEPEPEPSPYPSTEDQADTKDGLEITPEHVELTSGATGPSSVLEAQDPMIAAGPVGAHDDTLAPTFSSDKEEHKVQKTTNPTIEIPSVPEPTASTKRVEVTDTTTSLNSPQDSNDKETTTDTVSPGKSFPIESPKPSTSPTVPFPSSVSNKRFSTISNSPSVSSALSSNGTIEASGSSPSRSDGQSLGGGDKDKSDKKRNRLSSIKGFVRRISDQGLTRSPSGLRSPASEDLPPISNANENENTPLIGNNQSQEERERKISTHGSINDKKKKKKKQGKH
ncbi:uncharacterized protein IL334_002509 [Kwoniella shivajii]|uniref:ABC transporter n=1 Tax=Kwoniella shivajii TaxID=564305 RepID=A0ABZ1CW90_9TREE|nr:hypothetical protein IL334_002509 [Kwoniella shivajii]